jgi:hypothetical protein
MEKLIDDRAINKAIKDDFRKCSSPECGKTAFIKDRRDYYKYCFFHYTKSGPTFRILFLEISQWHESKVSTLDKIYYEIRAVYRFIGYGVTHYLKMKFY